MLLTFFLQAKSSVGSHFWFFMVTAAIQNSPTTFSCALRYKFSGIGTLFQSLTFLLILVLTYLATITKTFVHNVQICDGI